MLRIAQQRLCASASASALTGARAAQAGPGSLLSRSQPRFSVHAVVAHEVKRWRSPMLKPWYQDPADLQLDPIQKWYYGTIFPIWFRYFKGPYERYEFEHIVSRLRGMGIMHDDRIETRHP